MFKFRKIKSFSAASFLTHMIPDNTANMRENTAIRDIIIIIIIFTSLNLEIRQNYFKYTFYKK